jgi:hypothetical protein
MKRFQLFAVVSPLLITLLAVVLLATGCEQLKGGDPVVTTSGRPPVPVISRSVTLSWQPASGTVQGYKIEFTVDGSGFLEGWVTEGGGSQVQLSGLPVGHTYSFRVRAYNQGGNGAYTAATTIKL